MLGQKSLERSQGEAACCTGALPAGEGVFSSTPGSARHQSVDDRHEASSHIEQRLGAQSMF